MNFKVEDFTRKTNEKGELKAVNDRYLVQKQIEITTLNLLSEIKDLLQKILDKP